MPIPPQCQPLADEGQAIQARIEALRNDVTGAVGADAWKKLAELGELEKQLEGKRAELDACVKAHAGGMTCELVVMDAGGNGAFDDQSAQLWDMDGPTPTMTESTPVHDGAFSFAGPLPASSLAITVAGVQAEAGAGPDFRSGVTEVPPQVDGPFRLEVVRGPVLTSTAGEVSRWLSGLTIPQQSLSIPGQGPAEASIGSVTATLLQSAVRLVVSASVSIPTAGIHDVPCAVSASVTLVPSTAPDAQLAAELVLVDTPSISAAGPLALLGAAFNALSSQVFGLVRSELQSLFGQQLQTAVAAAFALKQLPPSTLSFRRIEMDPAAITCEFALGAVGSGLSTFQPAAGLIAPT